MGISAAELSEALSSVVETTGKSVVRVEGSRRRPVSGIAWSKTQVITVAHGLEGDQTVMLSNGDATFKATVKGVDQTTDIALLELVDGELPAASFNDGESVKVGQLSLLLARPGETVRATSGIVSAVGRKPWRSVRGGEIDRWLEADAPHQPGFSGGALVGIDGRVLGMTSTALAQRTSLTIPTTTLKKVVAQLQSHGRVRQSHLGLSLQPVQLPDAVRTITDEEIGLLVLGVEAGGPAEKAGVFYGDTVLHLGDDSVKTLHDLYSYLRADRVGQTVPVKLYRNGKVEHVQVVLGAK